MKVVQKNLICAIFIGILCLLYSCGTDDIVTFNGSKTTDANHFDIDFEVLNKTYTHEITMRKNESIDVSITKDFGDVSILIYKDKRTPIYKGDNVTSGEFRVDITEGGIYTLIVSGKNAKGHVIFSRH